MLDESLPLRGATTAWRNHPKWVVSRSLRSIGPNARLVEDDLEAAIRELKTERDGEIEDAGPSLAVRLMTHDRIGEDVIRLIYVPA
jgi:hypothetical protein